MGEMALKNIVYSVIMNVLEMCDWAHGPPGDLDD